MRTFLIIWLGQLVSSVGSSMTYFALTLWMWQQTESVTTIALIAFFYQLPQIAIALFSGILVDRVSRKHLLILSDVASACCTLAVGVLSVTQTLQLWHIYLIAAIIGCFGNIQDLTYSTTVPLIVPKQHHTRASSMGAMVGYGATILAPAFAGVLYPLIGLWGITLIDLGTFAIAILTLLWLPIPRTLEKSESGNQELDMATGVTGGGKQLWHEATFGFRYIASQPSLLAMTLAMSSFAFLSQIGEILYQPMILARTGGNAEILGLVVAASGVGGVAGAVILSLWSGFRRRVTGMLWGFIGTGLSRLVLGVGQLSMIWIAAKFAASLHSPLVYSSYMAVWYAKVPLNLQGRVFAVDYLIGLVIESSANLIAGPLADQIFEPAMGSGRWVTSTFGSLVGKGTGSGIALLYVIISVCILLVGIKSYTVRQLRDAEVLMPDYEATELPD